MNRSRWVPALYPLLALAVGALLLPSALRPPPEQQSDSAALNPNAPSDEQQEQIVQAIRQAQGGAGNSEDVEQETTTTVPPPPSSKACFGNPARQTESIYSAPCAPKFSGNNGGITGKNVFANEVRLGFFHGTGGPSPGRYSDDVAPNDSGSTRTFKVLQRYFNKHFETYGRKLVFYGLKGDANPSADQADARQAITQDHIFFASHLNLPFCEQFVRDGGTVMCNPERTSVYERNRPGFFSFMLDRAAAIGFGSEFVCKNLLGRKAIYSGNMQNEDRKISVVTESTSESANVPISDYRDSLKRECNGAYTGRDYVMGGNDATQAVATATSMKASGTTTVMVEIGGINLLLLMTAAQAIGWQPEWVILNAYGIDFNTIGALLPGAQSQHLFGITAWEVPRRFEETECYAAYKEIDPDNEADGATCQLFWHQLVLAADAIQEAGPHLDQASFEKGLFKLGHRYPVEPWAIGGGYGPGDYSYMDDVNVIWWKNGADAPDSDTPGAYIYAYQAKRFKRGELPADMVSQLFRHGVTTPDGPDVNA